MKSSQTKPTQERRNDAARREAFDQRDRSRRLGVGVMEPKSDAKLAACEPSALRMI